MCERTLLRLGCRLTSLVPCPLSSSSGRSPPTAVPPRSLSVGPLAGCASRAASDWKSSALYGCAAFFGAPVHERAGGGLGRSRAAGRLAEAAPAAPAGEGAGGDGGHS